VFIPPGSALWWSNCSQTSAVLPPKFPFPRCCALHTVPRHHKCGCWAGFLPPLTTPQARPHRYPLFFSPLASLSPTSAPLLYIRHFLHPFSNFQTTPSSKTPPHKSTTIFFRPTNASIEICPSFGGHAYPLLLNLPLTPVSLPCLLSTLQPFKSARTYPPPFWVSLALLAGRFLAPLARASGIRRRWWGLKTVAAIFFLFPNFQCFFCGGNLILTG
jgi:hypothetical protein